METQIIDGWNFFQTNSSEFERLEVLKNFPSELILKILSFLSRRELCSCCLVSRNWKICCEAQSLWKGWGKQLNIKETEINKQNVINKIIKLKENAQNAWPLLNQPVKTAKEFDAIGMPILLHREPTKENKAILHNLFDEIDKKLDLGEKIERGFQAHLLLRRIGLSSLEKIELFAQVLQTKYGQDTAYMKLALELVGENQLAKVEEFLTSALKKDTGERYDVIKGVIYQLCYQGEIQEAFDFLQKYVSEGSDGLRYLDACACLDMMLFNAKDKKLFSLWESIVDRYVSHRGLEVMKLIEDLIKEKMFSKAEDLLQKYQKDLESEKNKNCLAMFIEIIYVPMGKIQGAWDLALNYQGDNLLLLYALRNSFACFHMKEEKEKAEKMIEDKKAKGASLFK